MSSSDLEVACRSMSASWLSSHMKADCGTVLVTDSTLAIRVKMRSTTPILHESAGTKLPT
eukprot:7884269-Pyramimonas_sp.AAC.1